jgi:hypothetical protein
LPIVVESGGGFTQVTLTGTFQEPAGGPAAGTLTFTLTQAMANADVTIPPKPITATLDENGRFRVVLFANDDEDTVPQGVQYGVTEQVTGAQPRDYFILVSHTEGAVDISTLTPGEQGWT